MITTLKEQQMDKQRLTGAFLGVEKRLASMAPARTSKMNSGNEVSAFGNTHVGKTKSGRPSGGQDGLLGGLLLDCLTGGMLGSMFAEAVHAPGWVGEMDLSLTAEIVDEFWLDRRREQTGITLGRKGTISPAFGRHGRPAPADGFPTFKDTRPANDSWMRRELEDAHAVLRRRLNHGPAFA